MAGIKVQDLPLDPGLFKGAILTDTPYRKKGWDKDLKAQTEDFVGYSFEVALPAVKLEKAQVLVKTADELDVTAFELMKGVIFEGLEVRCFEDLEKDPAGGKRLIPQGSFRLSATATGVSTKPEGGRG